MYSAMNSVNQRNSASRSASVCTDCTKTPSHRAGMPAASTTPSMALSLRTSDPTKTGSDRRMTIADGRSTATDRTTAGSCNASSMWDRARAVSRRPGMMSDRPRALANLRGYGLRVSFQVDIGCSHILLPTPLIERREDGAALIGAWLDAGISACEGLDVGQPVLASIALSETALDDSVFQ